MKTAMLIGVLCLALLGLSTALVCPDGGMCEDKNTCCKNIEGGYGCCPLPHAECCSDHLHCCYEGTLCDLIHKKCVNKTVSLPWIRRLPSKVPQEKLPARLGVTLPAPTVRSVTCPGGKSSCPDSYTCCLLTTGDYGCCPYPEATCCSDRLHCCPSKTVCDVERGVCRSGATGVPLLKKVPAVPNDVKCLDGRAACPDQTTCCQSTNGTYGCCPMPNAVCCSDHAHCCPEGTQCDLKHSTCASAQGRPGAGREVATPATELLPARSRVDAVPCDDTVACSDGYTCCKSLLGKWACCPLPKAVCCDDHLHCCPHGTVCNLAASTCDDPAAGGGVAAPRPLEAPAFSPPPGDTKCDESKSCPGKFTCCRTTSGDWACCPMPEAVCCDDHLHCCPRGTVCNLAAETCDDPSGASGLSPRFPWAEKTAALTAEPRDEKCDKETKCPAGTTCCRTKSGQWACCPLPQAVCCSDHEHCCPKGYTCNQAERTCDKPGGVGRVPWLQKTPTRRATERPSPPAGLSRNACDPGTSCPRDTTCCFMEKTRQWGCCPLPNAVCCDDGNHCCPSGHSCGPRRSSCSRGPDVVPWFAKLRARTEPAAADGAADSKCDARKSCASGTTCCKLPTGEWGCCPLVKAV